MIVKTRIISFIVLLLIVLLTTTVKCGKFETSEVILEVENPTVAEIATTQVTTTATITVVETEVNTIEYTEMPVIEDVNSQFKSYMDYRYITDKSSVQWEMQQDAITDSEGFRVYNGLYMVAVGTGYADVCGIELKITLSSGTVIMAITGDIKANKHTDASNKDALSNSSILEFIIDTNKISQKCRTMGDMSFANMQGKVVRIEKIV